MRTSVSEKTGVDWIKELASELYEEITTHSPAYGEGINFREKDKTISEEEIEKVLSIIRKGGLILYPTSSGSGPGSQPAFIVYQGNKSQPGLESEVKKILYFKEDKLPEGYDFSRLSSLFLSKRNFELMRFHDMDTSDVSGDRTKYEY